MNEQYGDTLNTCLLQTNGSKLTSVSFSQLHPDCLQPFQVSHLTLGHTPESSHQAHAQSERLASPRDATAAQKPLLDQPLTGVTLELVRALSEGDLLSALQDASLVAMTIARSAPTNLSSSEIDG